MPQAVHTFWVRKELRVQRVSPVVVLIVVIASHAAPLQEVWPADGPPLATVSWTTRDVVAIGRARFGSRTPLAFAERAARLDAYGNLARAARLARIDADRRVGTLVDEDDDFNQAFQAYLRLTSFGPPQRGEDGWLTVTARAPLYGLTAAADDATALGPLLYRRDDIWQAESSPPPSRPPRRSARLP